MNPVTQSIDSLLVAPKHVRINLKKVQSLAQEISTKAPKHWSQDCPVDLSHLSKNDAIAFKFVFNAISFSYWGEPKWHSPANFERGTWNLIYSLHQANKEGTPILDSQFLSGLKTETLRHILRGNTEIPLFEERLRILQEIGEITSNQYNGDFSNVIEDGNYEALQILGILTKRFPSFNDSSIYEGKKIYFNKRAQLLVSDLAHEDERVTGVEELTACADYILPMVLAYKKAIELSPEVMDKISEKIILDEDSEEVNKIRMSTIKCVEEIATQSGLTQMQVNDYLWTAAPNVPIEVEYMRVRTTRF